MGRRRERSLRSSQSDNELETKNIVPKYISSDGFEKFETCWLSRGINAGLNDWAEARKISGKARYRWATRGCRRYSSAV